MTQATISAEIRRFIVTSIPSVPYLEAILLMHADAEVVWTSALLSQRLYVSEQSATVLLAELASAGIIGALSTTSAQYRYQPGSEQLRHLIDGLAAVYTRHLVEVTHLIHSKVNRRAQQFADAFKLRKDS